MWLAYSKAVEGSYVTWMPTVETNSSSHVIALYHHSLVAEARVTVLIRDTVVKTTEQGT